MNIFLPTLVVVIPLKKLFILLSKRFHLHHTFTLSLNHSSILAHLFFYLDFGGLGLKLLGSGSDIYRMTGRWYTHPTDVSSCVTALVHLFP